MRQILLIVLCVCAANEARGDYVSPLSRARYRAHAAYGIWLATHDGTVPDTPAPDQATCKCNGTKKSGDGQAATCECPARVAECRHVAAVRKLIDLGKL